MFDHIECFYRPQSVREALLLLRKVGKRGRILAGATDIVLQADRSTRFLVDITHVGLNYIRGNNRGCVLGATTTMAELEHSPVILALAGGILAKAAAACGSIQNRNMATVGGNLANASPAADTAAVLLALDAQVVAASSRRKRKITLADFYSGPHRTGLNGELLEEIVIPALPGGGRSGWAFQKLGRTETDISLVNVAAGLQADAKGRIKWARIALGAVGPTPLRARHAETLLLGNTINEDLLMRAGVAVMQEVNPISDGRASADYRREMSAVLARRALRECATQAGVPAGSGA
ncbi:MAG: xanthine dehydrogenase family protein subunit M [Terriglobia bacterium]|jgi:carbon-monoxide dehydrogenase medium subunit